MGKAALALSNFNAGELSPDVAGRVDNEKYAFGCDTLSNFIPRVQGPARRRPGSRFVQPVKNSSNRAWLRKFIFSQSQAYVVEFGAGYCRFYTNHGQVQVSGVSAWNNATAYSVGALVSQGGVNYYCILANANQAPPNATYWYALTGAIYEIPSPYTAAMLTNSDNTCGLQIEQSGDVLYIACGGYWPMTLTRFGATNWVLAPYAPPDGPFQPQNTSNTPALYIAPISGQPNQVTCFSTAPIFDPSDVATANSPGRLVRIGVQYFNTPNWESGGSPANTYAVGDLVRNNGSTYQCIVAGTAGPTPPIQVTGTQWDGKNPGACLWLYQDSGYGIGQVTAYTSPTQVTLTLSPYAGQKGNTAGNQYYHFPKATQGTSVSITGISQASQAVVTAANTFAVGDPVYITGVGGMTQITEQMYVVIAASATNFTIGIDSTGFSAYTSGGTAIKNASLNWQLGAWGKGAAAYAATFPNAVSFFEDRLFWAGGGGGIAAGINWWGSAPGLYSSHTQDLYSLITSACAITGVIAAQDVDAITWLSPANVLLIGTKGGEFALGPIIATQPLGPGNVQVPRQSKWRSRAIRAEVIGTSNFYVQSSGKKVMAQDYNFYLDRYDSTNQTRLANHIAGYAVTAGIIDIAWHQEPYETLFAVRNDGVLIGYVFDRPDNVTGWHEQPIGGTVAGPAVVECVTVIPAPDQTRDELWMIVNRTIGGVTVRSVEYLEKDFETGDAQNTMCYLDASGVYRGAPTTTIAGLGYLNGETVSVLRDGGGHPDCVVAGGQITLQVPGSVVQVGLKCPADLVIMRPEGGADVGTSQGKLKRTNRLTVRVKNTLAGYAGPYNGSLSNAGLDPLQPNVSSTTLGSAPPLLTGDAVISFPGDNDIDGRIHIQQAQPFQMEVVALFPVITVHEPSPQ